MGSSCVARPSAATSRVNQVASTQSQVCPYLTNLRPPLPFLQYLKRHTLHKEIK